VDSLLDDGLETRLQMHKATRASVFCRIAGIAIVLSLLIVSVSSAQAASLERLFSPLIIDPLEDRIVKVRPFFEFASCLLTPQ